MSRLTVLIALAVASLGTVLGVGSMVLDFVKPPVLVDIGLSKEKVSVQETWCIASQLNIWMANNGIDALPSWFDLCVLATGPDRVVNEDDLLDPWDQPYILQRSGDAFAIVSAGPDRALGTGDDIVSR